MKRENGQLGRRERKKLEVERRIRDVALELFSEKGYEATTVEEIAERADVAKGTFFNYFGRKDALLEWMAGAVVEELLEELGPVEEWEGTAGDQVLRLFLRTGELVARSPELAKVMLIENARNFWLREDVAPLERRYDDIVRAVLERAAERGEIVGGADVELGAKLLEAAYLTTTMDWLKAAAPAEEYRRELTGKFDIIFRGLGVSGPSVKG